MAKQDTSFDALREAMADAEREYQTASRKVRELTQDLNAARKIEGRAKAAFMDAASKLLHVSEVKTAAAK